ASLAELEGEFVAAGTLTLNSVRHV
ncbi:phosphohistidine phosphatase SixA, partial [Pseudomonas syringae pv. actinidiae ICMP 18804]